MASKRKKLTDWSTDLKTNTGGSGVIIILKSTIHVNNV